MQELVYVFELLERLTVCKSVIAHLAARKETRWNSFAEHVEDVLRFCPGTLISLGSDGKAEIKDQRCWGCTSCLKECPVQAIEMFLRGY